jgi:hypothetical protein
MGGIELSDKSNKGNGVKLNQRGLMGSRRKPLFKIGLFYLRIRMRGLEPKDKIVSYPIKINNEDQGPTRRGPQGSTFADNINYSLINVLNTLARVASVAFTISL